MNEQLKDYFYFSRGEKNGIIILLLIIVLLFALPYALDLFPSEKTEINKEFQNEIALFSQSLSKSDEPTFNNRLDQYIIERYDSLKLFFFNPNSTTGENFKRLGLTDKQINTINNYLDKGGKFYIKDDFRKIYGIRQQQYQILKPFILLPDNQQNNYTNYDNSEANISDKKQIDSLFVFDPNTASNSEYKKLGLSEKQIGTIRNYLSKSGKFNNKEDFKKIYGISNEQYNKLEPYLNIQKEIKSEVKTTESTIEINSATLEQLIDIKGIGKYTANEIIKYRQKLGGFVNIEQLLEIKSIKKETYEYIYKKFTVDSRNIKKISLNFSEIEDFVAHPYFNYYQAKEIVKFRTINGPYKEKKQLIDNKILLELSYKKVEPYISIN
jgi:competence protein ComEA